MNLNLFGNDKDKDKAPQSQKTADTDKNIGLSPAALSIVKSELERVQEMASYNKCNDDLSPRLRDAYAAKEDAYEVALSIITAAERSQRVVTLTAAGIQVCEDNLETQEKEEKDSEPNF